MGAFRGIVGDIVKDAGVEDVEINDEFMHGFFGVEGEEDE